ncbi:MAG: haloacid dehalogenase-like hydrolase [Bdellovibrionaceae bacterium]|nr:haloacid dehalogenase-like hydrolase [Pseudobdellovibrionaceae bacterium]
MHFKDFSKQIWDLIETLINSCPPQERIAAVDADGTLWNTDLGENFFNWIIHEKKVPLPKDPWEHYRKLKSKDPCTAYLWLAQILADVELTKVQQWANCAVEQYPPPIFPAMQRLVTLLHNSGFKVYVVTASVKWAVEPGANILGIPQDHVLGFATVIKNERVTGIQSGHSTYREGKAKALLEATGGIRPLLAFGNTPGDLFLLESAKAFAMAVSSAPSGSELFKSEMELQKIARERGWITHRFTETLC